MNDETELRNLLRPLLPPDRQAPSRDLWPDVVERLDGRPGWSLVDTGLAAFIAVVLLMIPEGVWLVAFHL
jgi:hypothetical protein